MATNVEDQPFRPGYRGIDICYSDDRSFGGSSAHFHSIPGLIS